MSFGSRLKKLRMHKGMSLQQAADAVRVSKAHIYELELGKVRNPSIEVLKNLASLFNVPVTHFLEDNDEMEFQVMFRNLEKDFAELDPKDREAVEFMIQALKARKASGTSN